ncbi:MAG: DUF2968 domain-containing protein [Pseudoxanthomonas sp.]
MKNIFLKVSIGSMLAASSTWVMAYQSQQVGGSPDEPAAASESTMASLQRLIDNHEVTEVRSVHNGSYAASLLFQGSTLSYFVTLSHGQVFWRVIQTASVKDAENGFHAFAEQTAKLAEVDIDTLRLEAGKLYAKHLVDLNEARLHKLQEDAVLQQRQGQQVAALQEQGRQKAVALSGDLRATSSRLDEVQQNIHQLEIQQGNPESSLPAASATPPPSGQVSSADPSASGSSASGSSP